MPSHRTTHAAKHATTRIPGVPTLQTTLRHVLVVVDGTTASTDAVTHGLSLAQVDGAHVTFVSAAPDTTPLSALAEVSTLSGTPSSPAGRRRAPPCLKDAAAHADAAGVMYHCIVLPPPVSVARIVDLIRTRRCDLVVLPCMGGNALTRLFGASLVPGLITASPVPLVVCKPTFGPAH